MSNTGSMLGGITVAPRSSKIPKTNVNGESDTVNQNVRNRKRIFEHDLKGKQLEQLKMGTRVDAYLDDLQAKLDGGGEDHEWRALHHGGEVQETNLPFLPKIMDLTFPRSSKCPRQRCMVAPRTPQITRKLIRPTCTCIQFFTTKLYVKHTINLYVVFSSFKPQYLNQP